MSWTDFFVVITLGSLLLLIATLVGITVDCWPEWKQAHQVRRQAYLEWLKGQEGA